MQYLVKGTIASSCKNVQINCCAVNELDARAMALADHPELVISSCRRVLEQRSGQGTYDAMTPKADYIGRSQGVSVRGVPIE